MWNTHGNGLTMINEHHCAFSYQAPYVTLNRLNEETQRIWLVFHGYGQLARFFIRKFEGLGRENFVIAPQGTAKYYLEGFYGRVGASWMTKEDRLTDIANQKAYLDSVLRSEKILDQTQFELFGFSQGVSTLLRYMSSAQLQARRLIIWAGSLPPELTRADFEYLNRDIEIFYYTGKKDPFYKPELEKEVRNRIVELFHKEATVIKFDGVHEVKKDLVDTL